MNWKLWLAGIVGVLLAGVAGYYSVFGISKLFVGAFVSVVIMAATLEVAKIVSTLLIHRYWERLNKAYRAYYVSAIIVLMTITSMGIYGYLATAYQSTSNIYTMNLKQIELLETQKLQYSNQIALYNDQIQLKYDRIGKLNEIRTGQETRLDTLYNRKWYNSARRTEGIIEQANADITTANDGINVMNSTVSSLQDSIYAIEVRMMNVSSDDATRDLGPLIYISNLTGYAMDKVVNVLILLFIFVFDPMALMLLITVQKLSMSNEKREQRSNKKIKKKKKHKITEVVVVVDEEDEVDTPIQDTLPELKEKFKEKLVKKSSPHQSPTETDPQPSSQSPTETGQRPPTVWVEPTNNYNSTKSI